MIVLGYSNRAAGYARAEAAQSGIAYLNGANNAFTAQRFGSAYEPNFPIYIERRSRTLSTDPWSGWNRSLFSHDPEGYPSIRSNVAGEVEYRFRHAVPYLTGYLRMDWDEIEARQTDRSITPAQNYIYEATKLEFSPRHYEFGLQRQAQLNQPLYRRSVAYQGEAPTVNARVSGGLVDASGATWPSLGFFMDWETAPSRVVAAPFSSTNWTTGVERRFWWDTWARGDLEYAELNSETPTHSPKLRFKPVFFDDADYEWYWPENPGRPGKKAIRGWIPLDDTSTVRSTAGATLRDPADDSIILSSLVMHGGHITSLIGPGSPLPHAVANTSSGLPFRSVRYQTNGRGNFYGRGTIAGAGLVSSTRLEYLWDGAVPEGYNEFLPDTWPVSPTYHLPILSDPANGNPIKEITLPFWYLRPEDQAVVLER